MNELSANQANPGDGSHDPKFAILVLLQQTLASVVRAPEFPLLPSIEQIASLKGCASYKRGSCGNRFGSHAMFIVAFFGLCFLCFREATAQVACGFGCVSAIERTTDGNDSDVTLPHQEVFTQLQTGALEDTPESELPNAPSAVSGPAAIAGLASNRSVSEVDVRDLAIESYAGKKPKTIDRQFLLLNALQILASVADSESTIRGVRLGFHEVNPILGSHPTRAEVYELAMPVDALLVLFSYHYKRVSPDRRWWRVYPGLGIVEHTAATVFNSAEILYR